MLAFKRIFTELLNLTYFNQNDMKIRPCKINIDLALSLYSYQGHLNI